MPLEHLHCQLGWWHVACNNTRMCRLHGFWDTECRSQ